MSSLQLWKVKFSNSSIMFCFFLGNVVSDGREAMNSGGVQNAHFGVKQDGSLFFG